MSSNSSTSIGAPEVKQQIIDEYLANDPTVENTPEIVKEIAEAMGLSPNGVRMVLTDAKVYLKKVVAASTTKTDSASGTGTKRVSKEAAISELKAAILAAGKEVDTDILDKLTGKAALYFTSIIKS